MSIDVTTEPTVELRDGARMAREEFHQAYSEYPDHTRIELVEGVVHMASPVSITHTRPHKVISFLGTLYDMATRGVEYLAEQTVSLSAGDEVQPDGLLRVRDEYGGRCTETAGRFFEGPPELIIEVANTSLNFDLNAKRRTYAANGVGEYLVVDLINQEFHWFDFRTGEQLAPDADGVCRVRRFPGFWLSVEAILQEDCAAALPVLHAGLASPEHAAFVADLAARRTPPPS